MSTTNNLHLDELLNTSENIKLYTCQDFKGNIEITIGTNMYLFFASKIKSSSNPDSELPIDVFDMNIEKPTPGSVNYMRIGGRTPDEKLNNLKQHCLSF